VTKSGGVSQSYGKAPGFMAALRSFVSGYGRFMTALRSFMSGYGRFMAKVGAFVAKHRLM
jgi:hypothetical protein